MKSSSVLEFSSNGVDGWLRGKSGVKVIRPEKKQQQFKSFKIDVPGSILNFRPLHFSTTLPTRHWLETGSPDLVYARSSHTIG